MEKRQDFPDAALTQEKARQQIRARHKAWRMELPQEEVQEKSRKICERLAASDWYHNSAVIYGYYPLGAEADCLPFLAQALSDGKTVALPVTSKERLQRDCGQVKRMQDTHRMEFYRIRAANGSGERMRWCWCPDWSLTVRGTGTGMAAVIMTAILQGFRSCPAWR